jgi:molybdenum cofactor cytidylyltransferase
VSAVGLIILAAGGSSRLGRPKQLLSFQGTTLLRHIAETALASNCHPIVIVLGAETTRCRAELENLPVLTANNPAWKTGMGSSIRTGLETLLNGSNNTSHLSAVVLMLCDQPFVSAEYINKIVEQHCSSGAGIVASKYANAIGVPALFSQRYFPDLAALDEAGAKQIILNYPQFVTTVSFAEGAFDIDTEKNYQRMNRTT